MCKNRTSWQRSIRIYVYREDYTTIIVAEVKRHSCAAMIASSLTIRSMQETYTLAKL